MVWTRSGVPLLHSTQRFQVLSRKEKFSIDPFSKGSSGRGWNPRRRPQTAKSLYGRRPARGELKNSPVDCFLRGEAMQERASPLRRP